MRDGKRTLCSEACARERCLVRRRSSRAGRPCATCGREFIGASNKRYCCGKCKDAAKPRDAVARYRAAWVSRNAERAAENERESRKNRKRRKRQCLARARRNECNLQLVEGLIQQILTRARRGWRLLTGSVFLRQSIRLGPKGIGTLCRAPVKNEQKPSGRRPWVSTVFWPHKGVNIRVKVQVRHAGSGLNSNGSAR